MNEMNIMDELIGLRISIGTPKEFLEKHGGCDGYADYVAKNHYTKFFYDSQLPDGFDDKLRLTINKTGNFPIYGRFRDSPEGIFRICKTTHRFNVIAFAEVKNLDEADAKIFDADIEAKLDARLIENPNEYHIRNRKGIVFLGDRSHPLVPAEHNFSEFTIIGERPKTRYDWSSNTDITPGVKGLYVVRKI